MMKKPVLFRTLLGALMLSFGAIHVTAGESVPLRATVIEVEDGDTLLLRFDVDKPVLDQEGSAYLKYDEARGAFHANLKGVDAAGEEERGGSCYAKEATEHLKALLPEGIRVSVEWDSNGIYTKDGRLLVYLRLVHGDDSRR